MTVGNKGNIPFNYFCSWTSMTHPSTSYELKFERYQRQNYNVFGLKLEGKGDVTYVSDSQLVSQNEQSSIINIMNTDTNTLFVRNTHYSENENFQVTISSEKEESSTSIFGLISMILFILMSVFVCLCLITIIRVCLRKRQVQRNLTS